MTKEKLDQLARNEGVIYLLHAPLVQDGVVTLRTTSLTEQLGDSRVHALALTLTDHAADHPGQGITRTTIGQATIVVTPNQEAGEVLTIVVPTGHQLVKSLSRLVRRYFEPSRPRKPRQPTPAQAEAIYAAQRPAESEATQ